MDSVRAPVETWPVHEFTYLNTTECSMTSHRERSPMRKRYWNKLDPDYVDGPGAESYNQLIARVNAFRVKIISEPRGDGWLNVFSHADFIRALMYTVVVPGGDLAGFRRFCQVVPIPNASFIRVSASELSGTTVSGPDVSHLPSHLITGLHTGADAEKAAS